VVRPRRGSDARRHRRRSPSRTARSG
jgi:hypothetical protein